MKNIFALAIICMVCIGCTRKILLPENYAHHYPKYWEKYTWSQVKDTIYADTVGKTAFYLEKVNQLLTDLKNDWGKTDQLYPQAKFNAVRVTQVTKWLPKKVRYMNEKQVNQLLKVLNNPLNFDWAETTFEADVKVAFLYNDKIVAHFELMDDRSVVSLAGEWEEFKKMKFGMLYKKPRLELVKLFGDLGFRIFWKIR